MSKLKIISLGWGVQSFTLAAMCALGELEMVDAAVHADTTHEMLATYKFAKMWTPWLEEHGVKVITVSSNSTNRVLRGEMIPAYTLDKSNPNLWNTGGMARRTCTHRWKIIPIRAWLQENRNKQPVESWFGISLDEAMRMKLSDVKYITNRYPLIEKRMRRSDCVSWIEDHGLEVPSQSSCSFCPFHNLETWRNIKLNNKKDWEKAVEIDYKIRNSRPPHELYLHPSRVPLEDVDLRNLEDHGQLRLWDEECSGVCGV